ncbi:MAG: RNA polymerase subunit sigma, partial [Chryseobacterium taeanense]
KAQEVSQVLNISTTNLWKILQRSRMQLRECLEFNWFSKS